MQMKTHKELREHLQQGQLCPVYLLYGDQPYLVRRSLRQVVEQAMDTKDPQPDRFDGKQLTIDALYDACELLPMFGQRRCVVVDDLEPDKLPAGEKKKLEEMLKEPNPGCVLVFAMTSVRLDAKKNAAHRRFIGWCEAAGAAVEMSTPDRRDLVRFIREGAQRRGSSITDEAAKELLERSSDDLQMLDNELDKLCAYRRGGQVERGDVCRLATAVLDASVFELARKIVRGDYQGAMRELDELFGLREEPVAILGALSGSFVDLYRAKVAREAGKSAQEVCEIYNYKGREFRIRSAMFDADRSTRQQLARALDLLAKADYRLKSGRANGRVVLEELATRLVLLRQNR